MIHHARILPVMRIQDGRPVQRGISEMDRDRVGIETQQLLGMDMLSDCGEGSLAQLEMYK
jgi:hypothetical protein